jgi:hypothetical protein
MSENGLQKFDLAFALTQKVVGERCGVNASEYTTEGYELSLFQNCAYGL